mgnify:CR=1 FL=1
MKIIKFLGFSLILIGIFLPLNYQKEDYINIKNNQREIEKALINNDYYAILEIPKINLKKLIYPISSPENNLNKTVFNISNSIFPGSFKSNVILAAHSGIGINAYFRYLYKLSLNDEVLLYYNNDIYHYLITEIEYQDKTGSLMLKEDYKDMITLITCTYHNDKTQTIYYAKMV